MRCVDLLDEHTVFAEGLGAIREAVHGRRLAAARTAFDALAVALKAHIELEETQLLPRFDSLDHPVPNGAPEVFRRDHRLLERLLDEVVSGWDDPVERASALAQLDGVLEHHDLREARYFKPRLDAELDPAVIDSVLEGWTCSSPLVVAGEAQAVPECSEVGLGRLRFGVAVGDVAGALVGLDELGSLDGKAAKLANRARARLQDGAVVEAWDAVRLLTAVLGAQPGGITA